MASWAGRLDIRDSAGRLVDFRRTHRFRHTKATSLLNAGVPIHVVQRYLGHLSPAMTMQYAQTLAETHEAEFLRYRKLTADGRDLEIGARDLYDMLQLDQRTDRVLPNGWCLLPPRQSCDRGNACLTCAVFRIRSACCTRLCCQCEGRVWWRSGSCSGSVAALRRQPRPAMRRLGGRVLLTVSAGWGSGSGSRS